jgi:hypothetical protein
VTQESEVTLREAIENDFNDRLRAIQDELSRLQEDFNSALARVRESAQSVSLENSQLAASLAEHLMTARRQGADEAPGAPPSADFGSLKIAVAEIEAQNSQVNVLNALLSNAARFADRAALFVIKNERALGWRICGPVGTIDEERLREIALPLTSDTLLSYVARSHSSWSGAPGSNADDNLLLEKLGGQPQQIAAVPLVVRGKTVAVLYLDSTSADPDSIGLDALETLSRVAAMAVAIVSVARAPKKVSEAAQPSEEPARQRTEPETPPQSSAPPAFEERPVQAIEAAEAEEPSAHETEVPKVETEPEAVPPPEVASMPMEPPPPVVAGAPAFGSQYSAPLGTSRRWGTAETDLPIEVSDEERRLHTDARRFARLLVSEIKLYNEQKVNEGRAQSDIYERLREDIERSRQMYEKRIAPPVAARFDYFHSELVKTLADGDPEKLGASYPGATVAVG